MDNRPVIMTGLEFDESRVSVDNPHGYLGDDNLYRFDRPESVALWDKVIDNAVAQDFQGIMWWQPGGWNPKQPYRYNIESHLVPPDVLPQLMAICDSARAAGLWCGSLLRPAELAISQSYATLNWFAFEELSADVKRFLSGRVSWQRVNGTGDAYYLDSFGLGDLDARIAKWLRDMVSVPMYTEKANDRMLRYTGGFCVGAPPPELRYLFPDAPWIAMVNELSYADRIAFGKLHDVGVLCMAHEIPEQGGSSGLAHKVVG